MRRDKNLADGAARRDAGVALAASPADRRLLIATQQLALLDRIAKAGTATTDDIAGDELATRHIGGGKWRGAVALEMARQKLIVRVGYAKSRRPARHAGTVAVWAAGSDASAIRSYRVHLRRLVATLQSSDRNN